MEIQKYSLTSNCCSNVFPFLLISLIRVNIATLMSCSTFLFISFSSFNLDEKRVRKTHVKKYCSQQKHTNATLMVLISSPSDHMTAD